MCLSKCVKIAKQQADRFFTDDPDLIREHLDKGQPAFSNKLGKLPELPESLSRCSPRFKPQLVHLLSSNVFTDTDIAACFMSLLGGHSKPHVIVGVSDRLNGLKDILHIDEVVKIIERNLNQVRIWTRSLLWVYHLNGVTCADVEPLRRFQAKFLCLALLDLGEKVLKFHLNYMFCRWSNQPDLVDFIERECPEIEKGNKPGYLLCGGYDQHLRRKLFSSKRRWSFDLASGAYSLIQIKRMWPPISEGLILDALVKHRNTIGGISRGVDSLVCDPTVPPQGSELELISQQVRRTVREVFGTLRSRGPMGQELDTPDKYVPSLSSHVHYDTIYSRADGGAFGYFSEGRATLGDHSDLLCMVFIPHLIRTLELRGYPRDCLISESAPERTFRADVHIVLEPAKARIITAGPPCAYTLLKPLQKAIWGHLHRHPTFQLIGGVPLTKALGQLVVDRVWDSDEVFVSADYSAATDNLHPALIVAAADEISDFFKMDDQLIDLYHRSLINHVISYPEEYGLDPVVQRWGQLMGSPSSFPILCLINAALCRYAMEKSEGRQLKLVDSPILINGDDAGFVLKRSYYQEWWRLVTLAGLEPSLGKNYISREFIMLNSELHLAKTGLFPQPAYFKYVPFVNFGLISGQSKVLGDTRLADDSVRVKRVEKIAYLEDYDISSVAGEIVRGFDSSMADEIISWYLTQSKDKIQAAQYTHNPQSWFLPKQLGGMGIPSYRPRKLTRGQSKLAHYLSVCPAKDYNIPGSLLVEPKKPFYTKLAEEQERKISDCYDKYWVEYDEEPEVDLDLNYKRYFSSVFHHMERPWEYRLEQNRRWDRLWRQGTNTSLGGISWEQAQEYRLKKVAYKRPGTSSVPVAKSLTYLGIIDNLSSTYGLIEERANIDEVCGLLESN